jgi:hypothetical protein
MTRVLFLWDANRLLLMQSICLDLISTQNLVKKVIIVNCLEQLEIDQLERVTFLALRTIFKNHNITSLRNSLKLTC